MLGDESINSERWCTIFNKQALVDDKTIHNSLNYIKYTSRYDVSIATFDVYLHTSNFIQ